MCVPYWIVQLVFLPLNALFMEKTVTMNEVVFENRNKSYGAYELRQQYDRHVNTAILISLAVCLAVISTPTIVKLLKGVQPVIEVPKKPMTYIELPPPPPIDKTVIPPPQLPPPPPRPRMQFVPPMVTAELVADEEVMPAMEDLLNVETSTETVEGDHFTFDVPDQPLQVVEQETQAETIYTFVEQPPTFPGGQEELMKYLGAHTKYPPAAIRNETEGTVFVGFIVSKDGRIDDVSVVKGISKECDEEAIRVIKSMPAWQPGKQNGRAVTVKFILPIRYHIPK